MSEPIENLDIESVVVDSASESLDSGQEHENESVPLTSETVNKEAKPKPIAVRRTSVRLSLNKRTEEDDSHSHHVNVNKKQKNHSSKIARKRKIQPRGEWNVSVIDDEPVPSTSTSSSMENKENQPPTAGSARKQRKINPNVRSIPAVQVQIENPERVAGINNNLIHFLHSQF